MYTREPIHIYTYICTYIHTHTSTRMYVNIWIQPHESPRHATSNKRKGGIRRDNPEKAREGRPHRPPGTHTNTTT